MSSNSRMTHSKGPAEELSLPPTRMRKDVSTANEGEKENAQGQVQANERNQPTTADMPSPFAHPRSRAGTCTTPASEGGMPPIASNPFARPDSRAGFAPPEPTSPQSSVSSKSDNQLQEDANMSVSWDLVDTDTDAEVANINSSLPHQTVTDQHSTGSTNTTQNNAVGLSDEINTLYNQDFFVADTTGRRLSQVTDKSNYSSLLPNGNAALQLRLPDLLIYLKTDTYLVDVKTGHHYAVYHNRIEKMSVLLKLYSAWPYRQLLQAIHDDAVRFGINSPEPATSKQPAPVAQPSSSIDRDVQTANKQHPSPCMPTIVNYKPPSFNLQIPKRMLTRSERDQVLRNHMTATNTTFNKVAVLEDLMQQEPHNAAHYKEVQRVQKNQHIQVAIKLQHRLEADDEFRQTAGLPQLDLPEHLWTVRNMDTAPVREQHFMAISSEVEVLRQQLKVKGMYPAPPTRMRKDVSTANEGEKENAQGQVQANERNQPTTADMPSPFAHPRSRAGTCTTPASEGGMPPIASNPFTRPDSRAGFAPPEPTSPQSSVSSKSDNQLQEDANMSVSWDLVDTDTDAEVANINSSLPHQTVTDQHSTGSTNTTRNNAVGLSDEINTLYNQDFFVADTTGRRLSQVTDISNYSSLLPNGNAALQLRLPDLLIYLKTDTYLVDVKTGHHYAVYHNRI